MDELTWDEIIDDLKDIESIILTISKKKKYHGTHVVYLELEDIYKFHEINRTAKNTIYKHLKEKKHILRQPLAAIELAINSTINDQRFHNGSVTSLLYLVQEAIKLVQKQKNNQSIYRIFQVSFYKNSVQYNKLGYEQTTHLPERLYTNKLDAFKVVKHRLYVLGTSNGTPKTFEIHCITNDKDDTWFIKLIKSCNIKKILEPIYRGQIFDLEMKQAFAKSVARIKENSEKDSENSVVKIKSFNGRLILVERYLK